MKKQGNGYTKYFRGLHEFGVMNFVSCVYKVFYISRQSFPVSFCLILISLSDEHTTGKNIWCPLGKPMCLLFNDYLFTIDDINTLRQSINFVSACFT